MCNLYRINKAQAEVANLFRVPANAGANFAAEVYPGYPGLVVTSEGVTPMTWGFPLVLKSKTTGQPLKPKPVNNAREDKLGTAFWRDSFTSRRCLIPVTAWAEADGPRGKMTRTWYSLLDQEIFAVAGIWRATAEWGHAYSMVMVDGCEQMADVNDRMPTILKPEDHVRWMDGTPQEAATLLKVWDRQLTVERTTEAWFKSAEPAPPRQGLLL
jgi:putative SOS response-associated peptidase YedK